MIIKVVLYTLNNLIILMTLSGNQDNISRLCQYAGCTDGFPSIYDSQYALALFLSQTSQHIVDDLLRLLESGVVAGDNHTVAVLYSLLSHQRTLTLIPVATSATYRPALTTMFQYFIDGVQHVLQRIRCMGIVHNGCHATLGADSLESSVYRFQSTQMNQRFPWLCSHHDGCAVDG